LAADAGEEWGAEHVVDSFLARINEDIGDTKLDGLSVDEVPKRSFVALKQTLIGNLVVTERVDRLSILYPEARIAGVAE
jgi:hypothetical protein